jgi:hypothetical protein
MTLDNGNTFLTFLLCSYAVGWCINGFVARMKRMLDLCQFVRSFLYAPFFLCLIAVFLFLAYQFVVGMLIPHWPVVLLGTTCVAGSAFIIKIIAEYAVVPAVKKTYGVAKPFSEKICIVMYRKKP